MPAPPPIAATSYGLDDPGRPIVRRPAAIAQRIASIVRQAGGAGVTIAQLEAELPIYSPAEISDALEDLPATIATVRDGTIYLVDGG